MANTTAQRISFVNKISSILKATSDDEHPTAGYLYKEINDISFESVGYSESLVEFLVDRLKNKSCHVKFKVLKLMKHVVENGSREFQLGLRKQSDAIKECTKFGGPPHPMHGNVPYMMVRNTAKELCELLYSKENLVAQSPTDPTAPEKAPESKYGGLGPVHAGHGGAIQGFGNTPTSQSKGIGETILGEIEKLGAKMSETVADRQAALLAKLDLSSSTMNYQPPAVVSGGEEESFVSPSATEDNNQSSSVIVKKTVKKHQPGKAGGGWGDDDDDDDNDDEQEDGNNENNNDNESRPFSIETDSLADSNNRLSSEEPQADWREESELVVNVLRRGSTGLEKAYLSPSTTATFVSKCSALCCDKVAELLAQKLASQDAGVVIRTLQLLEGIIFNKEELVSIDLLTKTAKDALVSCYMNCQSNLLSATQTQNLSQNSTSSTDEENTGSKIKLWSAAQAKSAKIILILQQLSSHKEILPASHFSSYLPGGSSSTVIPGAEVTAP